MTAFFFIKMDQSRGIESCGVLYYHSHVWLVEECLAIFKPANCYQYSSQMANNDSEQPTDNNDKILKILA